MENEFQKEQCLCRFVKLIDGCGFRLWGFGESCCPALRLRVGDDVRSDPADSVVLGAGRVAQRARIVLLAADGIANSVIADRVGVSRPTLIDHAAIITATLRPPPKELAVTHWSTRLLARQLGISDATVAKAWRGTGSSRGGRSRFGSLPTRSWSARSPTSSACT
jgi:DNA-binding CsgD family transcriptional regulator